MKHYTMTKIVATLGPATSTKADIKRLFDAGVTMFRLNSSHETPAVHQERLNFIREIEKEETLDRHLFFYFNRICSTALRRLFFRRKFVVVSILFGRKVVKSHKFTMKIRFVVKSTSVHNLFYI